MRSLSESLKKAFTVHKGHFGSARVCIIVDLIAENGEIKSATPAMNYYVRSNGVGGLELFCKDQDFYTNPMFDNLRKELEQESCS